MLSWLASDARRSHLHVQGTIFRDGFTGFKGEARDGGGGFGWNAFEWELK